MSHLEQEIHAQPAVIKNLIETQRGKAQEIAAAIREFDPVFVLIAARGTSDNAGRYAQYLMGIRANLPVALATPSVHTLYGSPPNLGRALVIGISQSGQSEDIRQVVTDANEQGALTVSITNDAASPLAQHSKYHLYLDAGEEISVAATKTYTAELAAVALLVTELVNDTSMFDSLAQLSNYASETLKATEGMHNWVERYRYIDRFASIGRGYNYCTAFEIGLKIKELCYISGEEYSEADFLHGPIAVVQRGFPVLVIAPQGKTLPGMLELLKQLKERQAECLVISNADDALQYGLKQMMLPKDMPEWLTPITAVMPGQIFAMTLADTKGNPIDRPIGLTKVTNTR